ncbi:MAG TPA: type II restriction endonuclease subunit M [Candidatus Cloacimonadota bacterium]|nr:type II restriction endonuclease subunit M [Candidatus Cloacimonadota bacterium]
MYEEELSKEEVTDKVLTENLYGLELDARCTQIAAFNLALTAWKFCGKYKELPQMNLACSGLAPKGKKEDWVKLVGKVDRIDDKTRMENGMAMLYDHFQLAPQLGSLLDPTTIKADLHTASFDQLYPALNNALQYETDKDILERGVIASGIAKAGLILSHKFSLQITNVPYLGRGRLDEKGILSKYCANKFPKSKGDIANVFMERMLINTEGTVCTVMPQNWLFLSTYKNHREDMLKNKRWNFIARLGHGGFSQISGEVVKAILIGISKQKPLEGNNIMGIDVSDITDVDAKSLALKTIPGMLVNQTSQMNNPGFIISFEYKLKEDETRLNKLIDFHKGICTGDRNRFVRFFFELDFSDNWSCFRSTSAHRENIFSGASEIIYWQDGDGDFIDFLHDRLGESIGAWLRGEDAWNKKGITISRVNTGNVTIYCGELFDDNISVLTPKHVEDLPALFCFIRSEEFLRKLKSLNQKLSVDNEYFASISIDIKKWKEIGQKVYPDGLPDIESDITTEYYYHGHPCFADYRLQAAIARLLGYRWPAEKDTKIGLTSRAQDLILNIKKYDQLSDKDGIICLPSVNTEETAANRLRDFLKEVFGGEWNNKTIQQLIEKENSKSANLENWLRNEFFVQHCKVFINRPFIWHIWDGRSDGFSALVNYHKLNKENLSKLIYTYLGDWIRMCESKKKSGESGAEGLLSAAQKLKEKLELILEGEKPYDIFIRWKPLEQQPIGWDPDLNDGVRLNIRPFIEADVLRKKPNIKWGIDRGKNPKGSPWGEIRDNDRHLTLAEKRAAREKLHL